MYRNKKSDFCSSVRPHLWEYAAGTLQADPEQTAPIEKHLARCPKCRAESEAFRTSASAMAAYASSSAEAGIPPRAPNWEAVQMRLQQNQNERQKETSVSGVSWLRALRTSPAFAGATIACGITTALCAVAIPWAISKDARATNANQSQGMTGSTEPVKTGATVSEAVTAKPVTDTAYSPVEMMVRPVFGGSDSNGSGLPARGTYPIAVSVVNHLGHEVKAHLSVLDTATSAIRRSERNVVLNADTKPQTFLLYPSVSNAYIYSPRQELQVALTGPFPGQDARISYFPSDQAGVVPMALIGDRVYGALKPKRQVIADHRREISKTTRQYHLTWTGAVRPEEAPERPAGYGNVDTLVLGQGAERLNTSQRAALRQWVIGGGSVIVLPGASLDLLGISPQTPFVNAKAVSHLLPPETTLHRYSLGMGAVLTVGADLTQDRFRDQWELPFAWDELRNRAMPITNAAMVSDGGFYPPSYWEQRHNDPFQIALPPLATLVYLFAGYFVLAVPITFVVLKQTRRMNWAWATGPALAAVFGGAVYGFTADLHRAKLSRRTTGTIVSAAGEKQARFVGTSELFFPTAGNYDVTVPGAETVELGSGTNRAQYTTDNYNSGNRDEGSGIVPRSLETVDNGTSVSVPGLSVPNLAFRRLNHAQPVAWGEGITADLKMTRKGNITGTIYNGTGRTLSNAYIVLQTATKKIEKRNKRSFEHTYPNVLVLNRIAPGITELNPKFSSYYKGPMLDGTPFNSRMFYRSGASPVLVGTTSGENMGPTIGQYVGGPDTVTVAVTLPPIRSQAPSAVQGGPK